MAKRTETKETANGRTTANQQEVHTYQVDKMTFIVTPVYRGDSNQSIQDLLLNLLKKEAEKPCN